MRLLVKFILLLELAGVGCTGGRVSAASPGDGRSRDEIRTGLELCIRCERDAAAAYESAGRPGDVREAKKRLRNLQETLDDLVLGFRGDLPDRRSPEQREAEEHARRVGTNAALSLESLPPFLAAEWLSRHQEADGRWDGGDNRADIETTSLALLVFLGLGETHRTPRFGLVVRSGFGFLAESQDADGCFSGAEGGRVHLRQAVAALAFCEGLRFTGSPAFRDPADRAMVACQRLRLLSGTGLPGPPAGASAREATAWMLVALRAGQRAALRVDGADMAAGLPVLERATEPGTLTAEAAAAVARLMGGATFADPSLRESSARVLAGARGERDPMGVWLGTILAWNMGYGSDSWKSWHSDVLVPIGKKQRNMVEDPDRGSFDPAHGRTRATETALRALPLEVDYRFARALGNE